MKIDQFKAELNDEQFNAATAPAGPALVLAAAGTGKTRTLVYRVAYLSAQNVPAERILLLTFTNRAAREMLDRAKDLVGAGVSGMWGGTFHHMANRVLRRFASRLDFPSNYTILDRDDSRRIVSACIKQRPALCADPPKPAALLSMIGIAANRDVPLEEIVEEKALLMNINAQFLLDVCNDYVGRKRELGAMDFDDLLVFCADLLRNHEDIRAIYQGMFDHILVDEYQDTNPIQAELVDVLGARSRNVMVVGDDFQSIYSWRGANLQNILSFPARYTDAVVYKLETNYRSSPEILAVANACIKGNPDQFQKTLRHTCASTSRPIVARLWSGQKQAAYVMDIIRQLRRNGIPLSQIAVLYRAHFHALDMEKELAFNRFPYRITSGMRFFEQAHIKDVCSIVQVAVQRANGVAFERLLCLFPGTGEKTVQKAWSTLGNRFDASSEHDRNLVASCLRAAARKNWTDVCALLAEYWQGAELETNRAGRLVSAFSNIFYEEHAYREYENAEARMEDIEGLIVEIERFPSADAFLSDMALQSNLDAEVSEHEDGEHVLLSTIHQAKGKEWQAVILLWASEGMFPSPRSVQENDTGEAEERRLFYVTITRAKEKLILCSPESRFVRGGGTMSCPPSRFLKELPPELVESIRPFV